MLFANFGLQGSLNGGVTERASDGRDADIRPVAAIQNKQAGERFTITLDLLDRENNLVQTVADGGAIHLRYSQEWLRAISVSGPSSLGTVVEYTVDNQLGHIDFAAVAEDEPALIDGTLATITFEANREIGVDANGVPTQITVEMVHSGPNASVLTLSGTSLLVGGGSGQSTRIIGDGLLAYLESEAGKSPSSTLAENLYLPLTMP